MKKRFLLFVTIVIAVLGISAIMTACDDSNSSGDRPGATTAEYSVTVLSPDETPLSNITVTWSASGKVAGSALTDSDGKASVVLPASTYSVGLSGYAEGLTYTAVSVNSVMTKVMLTLQVQKVLYTASVTDKSGAPAQNVTVTWLSGDAMAGSAVTGANGIAEREMDYGDYTVTVSNLPEGNVYNGTLSVTGKSPSASFALENGITFMYSVTVKTEGGLLFDKQPMIVYKNNAPVTSGFTDENGVYSFSNAEGEYTVRAVSLPDGYTAGAAIVSDSSREATVTLKSSVIMTEPASSVRYVMGDIIHNYSFVTPYEVEGEALSYTIADILKEKEAILINNWGTNCSWCVQEMPAMEEAYEKYKDSIEILAVSNYQGGDTDSRIVAHYEQYGYTFPMMRDINGLSTKFSLNSWPTTIVIDRYGAIARIESGAVLDAEIWGRMIEKYIGDDYVQSFTRGTSSSDSITTEVSKPDVVVPEDHYQTISDGIIDKSTFSQGESVVWRGETEYEYAWPFLFDTVDGVSENGEKVLYSSNTGKANSMSVIYATVNIEPGKVVTFDYYSETQSSDILYILWDGKIIKKISGLSRGWLTCNLYSEITSGSHTLAMSYMKDSSGNTGKDNVYIRNIRLTDINDITESTDWLRAAAYGTPEQGATQYPYYATVELKSDGYYHVILSGLENSKYAGVDESPLLLVNLLNATNWMGTSINNLVYATDEKTGEYVINCRFTVNGVTKDWREDLIEYMRIASSSDVEECLPVDKDLHDLLVAFMKKVNDTLSVPSHDNEWLEACYFYSHYGNGSFVGNPIMGLTEKTAIEVTTGTFTADLTRNMYPYPYTIYTFTPSVSGIYKIESLIPDKDAAQYSSQIWLYDVNGSMDNPLVYSGDNRFVRTAENEQNFEVYRYMKAGEKYYLTLSFLMAEVGTYEVKISKVESDSVQVLLPCSDNLYELVVGPDGNYTEETKLSGAVEYGKDNEGYYHVLESDGTLGDYIYFDVKYATSLTNSSITTLASQYLKDPLTFENLDYKVFDFTYRVVYFDITTEEGTFVSYYPDLDMREITFADSLFERDFRDYTADIQEYIDEGNRGDGLVKVDDRLVNILKLFIEMRINMLTATFDGEAFTNLVYEPALDNEWLRFCWYYRTYDSENP